MEERKLKAYIKDGNELISNEQVNRPRPVLEAIAGHEPVVILTISEYTNLVARAKENEEVARLLSVLADLGGLSDKMREMINRARNKEF